MKVQKKSATLEAEQQVTSASAESSEDVKPSVLRHIPYILNGELYIIKTQDGENVTVQCRNCPEDRIYRGSVRSTGNFHMHIKRRHSDLLGKLHEMKVSALLERRDRLIKSRKLGLRRKYSHNIITKPKQEPIDVEDEEEVNHMPKLKIKKVFQRHQRQQRQKSLAIHNSASAAVPDSVFAVDPNTKAFVQCEPLNFSLKKEPISQNDERKEIVAAIAMDNSIDEAPLNTLANAAAASASQNVSSTSSTNNDNIRFIKTDNLMPNQAVDLTTQTGNVGGMDSGISMGEEESAPNTAMNVQLLQELFDRVGATLQGIHHELNMQNRIKLNMLQLDIAKFKHMHPAFDFHF